MNIFKKLFGKRPMPDVKAIKALLVTPGKVEFGEGTLTILGYPFEPSMAYGNKVFNATEIEEVQLKSLPPAIKTGNELIFISAGYKEQLSKFATDNNIAIVERADIWGWILEPFLDTEFTDDMSIRLDKLLDEYGQGEEKVASIRKEVGEQMMKYNFDTMLWEWTHLGAFDVLSAMRAKYNREEFREFYARVMEIALLNKESV